ncbi:MAG: hypothetical protein JO342_07625 [Solirubrobacterales bacterium]|nr:hypothetical protein [Solirubrobacterales bacterium]
MSIASDDLLPHAGVGSYGSDYQAVCSVWAAASAKFELLLRVQRLIPRLLARSLRAQPCQPPMQAPRGRQDRPP